jgi:DNA polymerase-1
MVDLLSLVGDSVDNIRGVAGVGEKTAADLLCKYKTVENLLASVSQIEKPRLREVIRASADRLRANRQLITLRSDLTLPVMLDDLKVQAPDYTKLSALFKQFGFKSLLADVEEETAPTQDLFTRS